MSKKDRRVHSPDEKSVGVVRRKPTLAEPLPAIVQKLTPKKPLRRNDPSIRKEMGLSYDLIIE